MSPQPDNRHYVRRVVLPSGKTIEVVYFDDQQLVDPSQGLWVGLGQRDG